MDPHHLHHHVTHAKISTQAKILWTHATHAKISTYVTHAVFLTHTKIVQTHATDATHRKVYPRHPRTHITHATNTI